MIAIRGVGTFLEGVSGLSERAGAAAPDATEIGKPLNLAADGSRPALRIVALTVPRAKIARDVYEAPPDQRLVAVDLRIANRGDQAFDLAASGTRVKVADTTGTRYGPAILTRDVPGVLPRDARVLPHRAVRGRVFFAVPKGARLTDVRVSVGLGFPHTLHWELPRS